MPLNQAPTTLLAINGCNDTSETGVTDRTLGNADQYGDQLKGLYYDLTNSEAASASQTSVGTLYAGRYRRVQVDSGATASNVKTGTIGLMPSLAAVIADGDSTGKPTANIVTSFDQAIDSSTTVRPVVFLNAITPGNFGYVQELGLATVLGKSTLTNATPKGGDLVISATGGVVDDPTQTTQPTYAQIQQIVGTAVDLPVAGGKFRVLLSNSNFQVLQD
jgi:hypothetical protein